MKDLIILIVVLFFSCSNRGNQIAVNKKSEVVQELNDSTTYSNKEYKLYLYFKGNTIEKFKLYNTKNNFEFVGRAELVTVDGEIPEGTNRIDYNDPNDFSGYPCDSTYHFNSGKIHIDFAIEKGTKKRLDLYVDGFQKSDIENGGFTLVKQN